MMQTICWTPRTNLLVIGSGLDVKRTHSTRHAPHATSSPVPSCDHDRDGVFLTLPCKKDEFLTVWDGELIDSSKYPSVILSFTKYITSSVITRLLHRISITRMCTSLKIAICWSWDFRGLSWDVGPGSLSVRRALLQKEIAKSEFWLHQPVRHQRTNTGAIRQGLPIIWMENIH